MEVLLYEPSEKSVLYLLLRHLMFPIVIGVAAGLTANILFPRWQDLYLRRKAREERRLEIGENILALMNLYITRWRRLIEIAEYERKMAEEQSEATTEERRAQIAAALDRARERKAGFVDERSATRDQLMEALARYAMYDRAEAREEMQNFRAWDARQSTKRLEDLPAVAEWRRWEDRLRDVVRE